ncbi:hypothetical protein EfmE1636_2135 [Enterococcus faecium E1636]|nr:hypothetical protein EfmE1636_2135 [Enterococcus faecium E1636]
MKKVSSRKTVAHFFALKSKKYKKVLYNTSQEKLLSQF